MDAYTYAQVELHLAALHGALGEAQRGAFRARLKHLKRLGIPRGVSPGKGAKVQYRDRHLYEWAFALELEEFGIDPTVIVRLMDKAWDDEILPRFHAAKHQTGARDDICLVMRPNLMLAGWDRAAVPLALHWTNPAALCDVTRDNIDTGFEAGVTEPQMALLRSSLRRAIVINISRIVHLLTLSYLTLVFEAAEHPQSAISRELTGDDAQPAAPATETSR
jgi:hypothetical protein